MRFTAKGLQHALVDSHLDRGDVTVDGAEVKTRLWLSGRLRDSGESVNEVVDVALRLNAAGLIESAAASMNAAMLEKIRQARRS